MEVGDEDLLEVDEPDRRAQQLALRALAAVEEQPVAAAAHEQRRRAAPGGRRARGRAEEHDVEIHPAMVAGAPWTANGHGWNRYGRTSRSPGEIAVAVAGGCACWICQIASRTSPP